MKEPYLLKKLIDESYGAIAETAQGIANAIFESPELAFEERRAVSLLADALEREGFFVEREAGGLETALRASVSVSCDGRNDDAPRQHDDPGNIPAGHADAGDVINIGVVAEYDALPGLGHACGHNLIAASAFGAAVALKRVMMSQGIAGRVTLIGTPAEEDGGGKIILLERGVFDGLSVCMMMHPTSGMTRIAGECMSSHGLILTWQGLPAHAEAHPEDGLNALDALHIYYTAVACLRQQLTGDVRIAQIVTEGGTDIGRIPDRAAIRVDVVSEDIHLRDAVDRILDCARGAALAARCELTVKEETGYLGRLPNERLSDLFKRNFDRIGEPVMEGMPKDFGTTDFGNVMRVIPACNPYVSLLTERKISNHTEEFRARADAEHSERARHVIDISARVMACSALDILCDPSVLVEARREFERKRHGIDE